MKYQKITANMTLWHKYGFLETFKWQKEEKVRKLLQAYHTTN